MLLWNTRYSASTMASATVTPTAARTIPNSAKIWPATALPKKCENATKLTFAALIDQFNAHQEADRVPAAQEAQHPHAEHRG